MSEKRHGILTEQKIDNDFSFSTWGDESSKEKALAAYGAALDKVQVATRGNSGLSSTAALSDTYRDIDGGTSIRSPMGRHDYDMFRPNESVPKSERGIITACMRAYERVGIVQNIINLMADFACQGIKITHRNPKVEKFYRTWWDQINGAERSERFLNMFYRSGNVVVKRSTTILKDSNVKEFHRSVADVYYPSTLDDAPYNSGPDLDIEEDFVPNKNEIPWSYLILPPNMLTVIGGELGIFVDQPSYAIEIPRKTASMIRQPQGKIQQDLVNSIPADIRDAVRGGNNFIPLDRTKIITMFYKKDDWRVWAIPMLYSVLDDLIMLEKLRMADLTALDAAIQHIRVWRVGNLEHKIVPTEATLSRLADVLLNNVGGGSMDLLWGPDIDLIETKTDVAAFLGSDKYGPVLNSICSSLGIPLSLGGASDNSSYTNNFVSMKTLVERLTYGRTMLTQMWKKEFQIVQKAMGFRYPPELLFDNMNISEDASEKALWIQLYHSGLASMETMQERFGMIPEIEKLRIQRNHADIKSGTMPPKAGPYGDPNPELSLEKIALQNGFIRPADVGIKGKPMVMPGKTAETDSKSGGQPMQGRPQNSIDKNGRKKRTIKPRQPSSKAANDSGDNNSPAEEFISVSMWANAAQREISDIINPIMLNKYGKKNLRLLNAPEEKELERFKFVLLCNMEPFDPISNDTILAKLDEKLVVYKHIDEMKDEFVKRFVSEKGSAPSPDEIRQIQSHIFAICKGEF